MKSLFKCIVLVGSFLLFSACHDNNKEDLPIDSDDQEDFADILEIQNKVYNGGENIFLKSDYYGSGGSMNYNIDIEEGQHASISYEGNKTGVLKFYTDNLDLSTIKGNPVKGEVARPSLACFGTEVSMPVHIVPDYSAKRYRFYGEHDVAGVNMEIKGGVATSEDFRAWFRESFVYRENTTSGFKYEGSHHMIDLPEHDASYHYTVSPFIVALESSDYPEERSGHISLSDVIQVLMNTPMLKESEYGFNRDVDRLISISTLWGRLIPGFALPDDLWPDPLSFHIIGMYCDMDSYGSTVYGYPSNTFCASDVTDVSYLLSIDPAKVFRIKIEKQMIENGVNGVEKYALNTPSLYSLLSNIFLTLTPMNAEGIKMDYEEVIGNGDSKFKSTFSDKALGLKVLKTILCSVFSEPEVVEHMKSILEDEGMTPETLASVIFVANNLENILNNASEATFGWSYHGIPYNKEGSNQDYYNTLVEYYNKLYEN